MLPIASGMLSPRNCYITADMIHQNKPGASRYLLQLKSPYKHCNVFLQGIKGSHFGSSLLNYNVKRNEYKT